MQPLAQVIRKIAHQRPVAREQDLADEPLVSLRMIVVDGAANLIGERLARSFQAFMDRLGRVGVDVFGQF